ncbi:hypothetical protein BCR36DRAFT_409810 [Piromyces finnis]|uniref:Male-enhanced antigen 1 n=1 Tax=Piromyces finnis TaxID=1754191 RepID=A0A1Y1VHX1_9FUNG|nr:hypothetical protein BCR36DRAFT_409810 [Piromyces finnis]|eukprot:ORX56620.1 hypothetical protein BCR36DRAFT_409810 [Piromyces finnis]
MDKSKEDILKNNINIEEIEKNKQIEKESMEETKNNNENNNEIEINNNDIITNNDTNNNDDNNNIEDSIFDDDFSFKSKESNDNSDIENEMDDPYSGYMPLNGYCLLDDDEENEDCNNIDEEKEKALKKNKLVIEATKDSKISEDDLNIINSVMSKISIPESSIPEWAKKIPEELWMPEVINKE